MLKKLYCCGHVAAAVSRGAIAIHRLGRETGPTVVSYCTRRQCAACWRAAGTRSYRKTIRFTSSFGVSLNPGPREFQPILSVRVSSLPLMAIY